MDSKDPTVIESYSLGETLLELNMELNQSKVIEADKIAITENTDNGISNSADEDNSLSY